jgi:uncharacterized protein (DUF983 family)
MWQVAKNSVVLFLQGRLFADPTKVFQQLAVGIIVTAAILFVGVRVGMPLWIAGLVAGLIGGALQPYLFRNLRYR